MQKCARKVRSIWGSTPATVGWFLTIVTFGLVSTCLLRWQTLCIIRMDSAATPPASRSFKGLHSMLTDFPLDTRHVIKQGLPNVTFTATQTVDSRREATRMKLSEPGSILDLTSRTWQEFASAADVPLFHVDAANCDKLFAADRGELQHAENYQHQHPKKKVQDQSFVSSASNCEAFLEMRRYILKPVSQEEAEFAIAFSLLVFKDAEQVERLLRAIYRPQNYYCIHIDAKSQRVFRKAVETLANCFNNVFITSRSVDVRWGTFSVLEPELICMEELWRYRNWKYFINLTGQEFPLKTNWDLVKILKAYRGANDLEGTVQRFVGNVELLAMYWHYNMFCIHLLFFLNKKLLPVTVHDQEKEFPLSVSFASKMLSVFISCH